MARPEAPRGKIRDARREYWSQVLSRGAVADLADAVETPAIHGAGIRHATAVGIAGAYRRETHVACHAHGRQALGRGPVAQLAVIIVSPAIDGARGGDPAAVLGARAHRGEGDAPRHGRRGQTAIHGKVWIGR